jgi:hypothetical protein
VVDCRAFSAEKPLALEFRWANSLYSVEDQTSLLKPSQLHLAAIYQPSSKLSSPRQSSQDQIGGDV